MRVGDLTWEAVAARIEDGALGILPVGAGAKQHGLHLPMASDCIQAEWIADRLATRFDALIWPVLTYGHYPAFATYAGSATLSAGLFEQLIGEVATSLMGFGLRGLVVVDTGISTIAPIDRALARLAQPGGCLHLKVYDGARCGHADAAETSIMLALAPESVAMDRAAIGMAATPAPGPLQWIDPAMPNHSPTGGTGDPRGATREAGVALVESILESLAAQVDAWLSRLPASPPQTPGR